MKNQKELIAATGLKFRYIANILNVSYPTVKNWSCGRIKIPEDVEKILMKIINAHDKMRK